MFVVGLVAEIPALLFSDQTFAIRNCIATTQFTGEEVKYYFGVCQSDVDRYYKEDNPLLPPASNLQYTVRCVFYLCCNVFKIHKSYKSFVFQI